VSRPETDEAMFVTEKQLLMFIPGDGRAGGTLRTVAKLAACDSIPIIKPSLSPVAACVAATGLLRGSCP